MQFPAQHKLLHAALILLRCCCATDDKIKRNKLVLGAGVGGPILPLDMDTLYKSYPTYQQSGQQFAAIKTQTVGPKKSLFVGQRELAASTKHDKSIDIIGSDDATTCIVGILFHKDSGATGVVHFDGSNTARAVDCLVCRVKSLVGSGDANTGYRLYLVGGIPTPDRTADSTFSDILSAFNRQGVMTELELASVGRVNTQIRHGANIPIHYGAAINMKNGKVFPATFADKEPVYVLRNSRLFVGTPDLLEIYDSSKELVRIGPFDFGQFPNADLWANAPDKEILQNYSTTPQAEKPYYPEQFRKTIAFIRDHPHPLQTVFKNNQPLYFKKDLRSGKWVPV